VNSLGASSSLAHRIDARGDRLGGLDTCGSALAEVRIVPNTTNPRVRPGPDRITSLAPRLLQTRWLATSGTDMRFGSHKISGLR
jgi:hypothetical protein